MSWIMPPLMMQQALELAQRFPLPEWGVIRAAAAPLCQAVVRHPPLSNH